METLPKITDDEKTQPIYGISHMKPITQVYDNVKDAVVSITSVWSKDQTMSKSSGFFCRADGYICTSSHGIMKADSVKTDNKYDFSEFKGKFIDITFGSIFRCDFN